MSRKSRADLAVVPLASGGRPAPPDELDELERSIWTDVVDACPPHAVDPAAQVILRRLTAQAALATRMEERLRALRAQGKDQDKDVAALLNAHATTCKTVTFLLTSLRCTPRSRVRIRDADPAKVPITRPWERKSSA